MLPRARREFVMKKELCLVCYEPGHEAKDCKLNNIKCKFGCKARHNTAVHVTLADYKGIGKSRKARTADSAGAELANLVCDLEQNPLEPDTLFYMNRELEGPVGPRRHLMVQGNALTSTT